MKKIFFLLLASALLLTACGPSHDERIQQITAYEQATMEKALGADTLVADTITSMYEEFANKYPQDSLTPTYLFKAGEVQANVLHADRSVAFFHRIMKDYPQYKEMAMCYYFIGYAYELNSQYDLARKGYEDFIAKYPDHPLARDTKKALPLLGMSYQEQLDYILAHASDTIIAQNNQVK